MKKHVFGLLIFGLIVSAAAIVYAVFNVSEIIPVFEMVSVSDQQDSAPTSCWRMNRGSNQSKTNSIEIRQAVLNLSNKQFNSELAVPARNEPIALHFFAQSGKDVRYITSEIVENDYSTGGTLKFSNIYGWMGHLKSLENLYVIAQFKSDAENYKENYQVTGNKFHPKFDAAKAVPVTLDYGE